MPLTGAGLHHAGAAAGLKSCAVSGVIESGRAHFDRRAGSRAVEVDGHRRCRSTARCWCRTLRRRSRGPPRTGTASRLASGRRPGARTRAKVMDTLGSSRHGQQILAAWIGKEKLRDALNLRARTCTRGGSRAPAQAKSRSPLGNRAAVRSGLTSGSRDTAAVAAVPPACDPAPGRAHAPAAGAL